jgi:ribosomal protein L28
MAKQCSICGKSTQSIMRHRHKTTSNISRHGAWGHRAPRTPGAQKPNLRKALVTNGDVTVREWVCMKCYKKSNNS